MANRHWNDLLQNAWSEGKFVCVGLDSNIERIPGHLKTGSIKETLVTFNKAIIDATKDLVCAYKPNTAFYEAYGAEGIEALKDTCDYIHEVEPDVAIVLDAKRADIGNTNNGYVQFAYDYLGTDAITLHPYLGGAALQPFLERADKGCIILARTSNEGSRELQDIESEGKPYYMHVAETVAKQWNAQKNCALVVGATYPEEMAQIRAAVPDVPFLIPGIGAQGGDVEATVKAGQTADGTGMMINSSRGIIFASDGEDFADAARTATEELHNMINQYR